MSGQFNFGPGDEEFERFAREMGDGLRDMFGKFLNGGGQGGQINWSKFAEGAFGQPTRTKTRPEPEPTADTGSGVWAIVINDDDGVRVEQVFATEIDALRANQNTSGDSRRVRFLPYGIPVSAFDRSHKDETADAPAEAPADEAPKTKPKSTAKKPKPKKDD
ncbi:MAG: hypothetical protein QM774_00775 [Gordonia sp. (in: high G+C Gram-positive bacteria)]|uniref:hypothetical protein n=1 Tax=Gordonia sp. (in: high G+C Gram-positive bacteria) TaxID=84139 RepID=UPI0039E4EDCE